MLFGEGDRIGDLGQAQRTCFQRAMQDTRSLRRPEPAAVVVLETRLACFSSRRRGVGRNRDLRFTNRAEARIFAAHHQSRRCERGKSGTTPVVRRPAPRLGAVLERAQLLAQRARQAIPASATSSANPSCDRCCARPSSPVGPRSSRTWPRRRAPTSVGPSAPTTCRVRLAAMSVNLGQVIDIGRSYQRRSWGTASSS